MLWGESAWAQTRQEVAKKTAGAHMYVQFGSSDVFLQHFTRKDRRSSLRFSRGMVKKALGDALVMGENNPLRLKCCKNKPGLAPVILSRTAGVI